MRNLKFTWLLSLVLLFCFENTNAQDVISNDFSDWTITENSQVAVNSSGLPSNVKGSPYFNSDFVKGTMLYKGEEFPEKKMLRYNAYTDRIEIQTSDDSKPEFIKPNPKIDVLIGDQRFCYRQYFDPITKNLKWGFLLYERNDGEVEVYQLLSKYLNSKDNDAAVMTAYQSEKIASKKAVMFKPGENLAIKEFPTKKKTLYSLYGEKAVKKYIKEQKPKLSKPKDVAAFLEAMNNQ